MRRCGSINLAEAEGKMGMRFIFLILLTIALALPVKLALADIAGRASVIDGDTLEIRGTRIRLYGIDSPESGQTCLSGSRQYRCGQRAALALSDKIGSANISCERKNRDRYGRIVAVCRLRGEDLNGWMVSQGWALAYRRYSRDYTRQERRASSSGLGVWQGKFIRPWEWRRGKRLAEAKKKETGRCLIKGNISRRGERIYHVPGGQYYSRTGISPSKGERWFCSEAEARAAGWRRSKR